MPVTTLIFAQHTMPRVRMVPVVLLLAALAAFVLIAIGVVRSLGSPKCQRRHPENIESLEAAGARVVRSLDASRQRTGRFPETLREAGIDEQSTYGPWRYNEVHGEFVLALGDYGSCFWESSYSSKRRSWYHDR